MVIGVFISCVALKISGGSSGLRQCGTSLMLNQTGSKHDDAGETIEMKTSGSSPVLSAP